MRVALGTVEVSDEARKAIRQLNGVNGGKGDATRGEVKEYLLSKINDEILPNVGKEDEETNDGGENEQLELASNEELPEPPTDGAGYTGGVTAATGTAEVNAPNLGSAGVPGGSTV